jgi:tetratricopeptide (TPR) repeat protein
MKQASHLSGPIEEGQLDIEPIARNAVVAMHAGFPGRALVIGAGIGDKELEGRPLWRVIGSFGKVTRPDVLQPLFDLQGQVILIDGTPPGTDEDLVKRLRNCSVTVMKNEKPPAWVAIAQQMIEAIRGRDDTKLAALLDGDHDVVAKAMIGLIAGGERATAQLLGDAALAKRNDPAVRHQVAVLATLAGDHAAAERHLRAAIGDPVHAPSLINLAIVLARKPEHAAEAIELADRAVELMPEDPLAHIAAVLTRAYAGRLDDAKAKLGAATPLDELKRTELGFTIDSFATGERPPVVDTFPQHAQLAAERGRQLVDEGKLDDAIVTLQRAYELHPLGLEIAGELGYALGQAGRDAEAIALYDAAIPRIPGGDLLRVNRGNARRRAGDTAGAIADYQTLLKKKSDLVQARVGMVLALADAGRADDATIELAVLAEQGVPIELVNELRAAIEGRDPR